MEQNFKLGDEVWSNYYRKGVVISSKTTTEGTTLIEVHFVFFVCYVTIWFYSEGTFHNEQDKIGNPLIPIAEYNAPRFNGVITM